MRTGKYRGSLQPAGEDLDGKQGNKKDLPGNSFA